MQVSLFQDKPESIDAGILLKWTGSALTCCDTLADRMAAPWRGQSFLDLLSKE